MTSEQLTALLSVIQQQTTDILRTKGVEYSGEADRLANFKRGAAATGLQPLTVLFIYFTKHVDSFGSYVKKVEAGFEPKVSEPIESRLADIINYAILAWALIEEQKSEAAKP